MDNVTEVELVLASGRILYLKDPSTFPPLAPGESMSEEEREQREIWWGFKGAGTTLGIVTRLRSKAFKVGLVFSGNLI